MIRLIQRVDLLAACAILVLAAAGPARAVGTEEPAKPATAPSDQKSDPKPDTTKADTKSDTKPSDAKPAGDKKSEREFREGYKLAYDAIYKERNYAKGLAILTGLGHDDHPDVANLIGFSSRKLGRVEDAKVWYEKALAADPRHTRTWQYYGLWHLEQGDRAKAEDHLEKIRLICGQGCEDYRSLRDALNSNETY